MTKRNLIEHFERHADTRLTGELKKVAMRFINSVVKELPGPDFEPDDQSKMTLEDLLRLISYHAGISVDLMRSSRRTREIVIARQVYCYLAKQMFGTRFTLKKIGLTIGERDHTTVIHSVNTAEDYIDTNEQGFMSLYKRVNEIVTGLNSVQPERSVLQDC